MLFLKCLGIFAIAFIAGTASLYATDVATFYVFGLPLQSVGETMGNAYWFAGGAASLAFANGAA